MNKFAAVTKTIESCTTTQTLKDFLFATKQKPYQQANPSRTFALETSYLIEGSPFVWTRQRIPHHDSRQANLP